ncbi:MAG: hypothetical protein JJU10_02225 [Idiomarina sp.]|nr:hypothetical protein [Idiomarina sp.]
MLKLGTPLTVKMLAAAAGLMLIMALLGYYGGHARIQWQNDRIAWHERQMENLHQQVNQLEYQKNILQVELDVERAASRALQGELRGALEDNAVISRELAFYQRVMAPELDADGVAVDSLVVAATGASNSFYFRLILLQLERAQQLVTGQVTIQLRGQLNGERQQYSLIELAGLADDASSFSMNYFSLLEGTFQLPDGFQPETISVHVRSGRRQLERVFQWQELMDEALNLNESANQ